ncbi:DUF21 domain-containing protein [bacterium]|nr:DUF21 domain-containing protein [bacterium]
MNEYLLFVIIAVVLSAFFSGTETAYTVAGKVTMEVYRRHGRAGSRYAHKFYRRPNLLFATSLVGTNLANVLYSSVFAIWLNRLGVPVEAIVVISPVVLLFFGEILPKTVAREGAEPWALWSAVPLHLMMWLLFPLVIVAQGTSRTLLSLVGAGGEDEREEQITLADLTGMSYDLKRTGTVDDVEADLLDRVLTLRRRKLKELMTPRTQMVALPVTATRREAEETVQKTGYTRIPVYEDNIDHIIGVLHAMELLQGEKLLREQLIEPIFLPDNASALQAVTYAQRHKAGLLIVVDEHGGTAGIVTIEDVLEELVGEIEDEYDRASKPGRQISQNAWLVHARTEIGILKEHWGITLPEGEFETVGGLVTSITGTIPKPGEVITVPGWTLRVADADDRRVKRVLIRKQVRLRDVERHDTRDDGARRGARQRYSR